MAQEPSDSSYIDSRILVVAGIFFPDRQLRIGADGTLAGDNVEIDFNERLRISESDSIGAFEIRWKYSQSWSLNGQFFSSAGRSSLTLQEDIDWEDAIFQAGTGISAGTGLDVYRVFFGRDWKSSGKQNVGIGLGLHLLDIDAALSGTLITDDAPPQTGRRAVSTQAPLPNIGAWYRYPLTEKLVLSGRIDWLSARVGDYDGQMTNLSLGVNYELANHVGIGLSYLAFELDVEIDKADWRGSVNSEYEGLFASISFFW